MKRAALVALLAATMVGCGMLPALPGGEIPLDVSGSGTFQCGNGTHGCSAWLAIRPAGWEAPEDWAPGEADRDFRPRSQQTDMSQWLVSGSGVGGPESLAPGDYRFMAVITQADDTTPWVLGTDDQPGTGVLSLTMACEERVAVPAGATAVAVVVTFGPECSIESAPA